MDFNDTKIFKELEDIGPDTLSKLKKLLDLNHDVTVRGAYEETYFHVLASPRDNTDTIFVIPIIHLLAQAGVDVNALDREGNTALHICVLNGLPHEVVAHYLKVGADPSILNNSEQQALDLVTDDNVKTIIEHSYPGLASAIRLGDAKKAERMLEFWHNVDQQIDGKTLTSYCQIHKHSAIRQLLINESHTSSLVTATLIGDLREVKRLSSSQDVDLNTTDYCHMRSDGVWAPMPLLAQTIILRQYACAKVLCKKGADVNIEVGLEADRKDPMFLYILRNCPPADAELIRALLDNADASLVRDVPALLYKAWQQQMPSDIVELLIEKGLRFTMRDDKGYTVRDRIFLACYDKNERFFRENLYFIDRHVIKMAMEAEIEKLRVLALDGYDYINVLSVDGTSTLQLAKNANLKKVVRFMNTLPELQRSSAMLHKSIEKGNYAEFKELINDKLIRCRDKGGRTPLHKAVLFERMYIVNHILSEYPEAVSDLDYFWRTPLHYACMIPDSGELEEQLKKANASTFAKDFNGSVPSDYRDKPDIMFIANERHKEYDLEVFLLDRYLNYRNAINNKDMTRMNEVSKSMYGVSLNEFEERLPGRTKKLQYRNLLFYTVSAHFEMGGIHLVQEGMDHAISEQVNGHSEVVTLVDAVEKRNMLELLDLLRSKKAQLKAEYRAKLTVIQAVSRLSNPYDRDYTVSRLSDRLAGEKRIQRPGSLTSHSTLTSAFESELMDIEESDTRTNSPAIDLPSKKRKNRSSETRTSTRSTDSRTGSGQTRSKQGRKDKGPNDSNTDTDEMMPTSQACIIL